ncbi:MAG TPA: hypothetical protein VFC78_06910 [Tepidisphaeraceae bacterium]|nr:hypothetical protein [Tepidisphaeraceae bacterium]
MAVAFITIMAATADAVMVIVGATTITTIVARTMMNTGGTEYKWRLFNTP